VNCNLSVSLFLHDIDFTTMSDVVRVLQGVTHMYTGMCIHSNSPFRVRIRIHIRDKNSHSHLLCSDSYSYSIGSNREEDSPQHSLPVHPSSLTHVHRCIDYRHPNSLSKSVRRTCLSVYDSRDSVSESTPSPLGRI
jgi:hypothetical protein